MKQKPWPILLVALIQWLSPVGDLIESAIGSHMSIAQYLHFSTLQYGLFGTFFWLLAVPSVSGCAVYAVKGWSYPVFVACVLFCSYDSVGSAIHVHAGWLGYSLVIGGVVGNLVLGSILLLPEARKAFLDKKQRWWEARRRYLIELQTRVFAGDGFTRSGLGKIVNISTGGALVELESTSVGAGLPELTRDDVISLRFAGLAGGSQEIFCEGRVTHTSWIHHIHLGEIKRVGVEFVNLPRAARDDIGRMVGALKLVRAPTLQGESGIWADLKFWWQELVSKTSRSQGSGAVAPVAGPGQAVEGVNDDSRVA